MSYEINYTDGYKASAETLDECEAIIRNEYPDAVFCGNGESVDEPCQYEIDNAGRILVWAREEDSIDDAGANAIASIYAEADDIGVGPRGKKNMIEVMRHNGQCPFGPWMPVSEAPDWVTDAIENERAAADAGSGRIEQAGSIWIWRDNAE
jgi:hypothetical protein